MSRVAERHFLPIVSLMKASAYLLFAFAGSIIATVGFDIVARMTIAGASFEQASAEHLAGATSEWLGTAMLIAPFLAVGCISAVLHRRGRLRSALLIFILGTAPLLYFYFDGHHASQQALMDGHWTASALSVGLLPFLIGAPVAFIASMVGLALGGGAEIPTVED